jgi:uncharacterized membrane protein
VRGGIRESSRGAALVLFATTCGLAVTLVVASPVLGWFPVIRMSAVFSAVLITGFCVTRPWSWTNEQWTRAAAWVPSRRAMLIGVTLFSAVLWWLVYSRFEAGGIDAVDFTVYFDRPLYQTSHGRPLFVESTNEPRFARLSHLAVHGYWLLFPISMLYRIYASPLWLLSLSVAAVVAGAFYIYRIVERCGATAAVAAAAAFAFAFDGNTARALNYGFHPEVLYAWFVPWAIYAGLRSARTEFLLAVIACLLVKEDAIFPLFATSVALALTAGRQMKLSDRVLFLLAPTALALVNLAAFYLLVVPRLSPDGQVMYSYFWSTRGATPYEALIWLVKHPLRMIVAGLTSGFFTLVVGSYWHLPLLGWRWIIGVLPLVFIYGASDSDQIRGFGIYYSLPLIPFLTIGTAAGARKLISWFRPGPVAEVAAAAVILATTVSTGLGYSLRPWKGELKAVPEALAHLAGYDEVLVQGGLYPHAGYEGHVQLLTRHDLRATEGARVAILLATRGSTYPLKQHEWKCLTDLPRLAPMPHGLLAILATPEARGCIDEDR